MENTNQNLKINNAQKKYTIILLVVVTSIIVVTSTIIGLYFGLKKTEKKPFKPLENNYFAYALVKEKGYFTVPEKIFCGNDIKNFKIVCENDKYLSLKNYVITLKNDDFVQNSAKPAFYKFFYEDVLRLTIEIYLVDDPVFVRSPEDLNEMNDQLGDYVQVDDIDLKNHNLSITQFKGRYFGNHFKISNLNIATHGSLFQKTQSAFLLGVVLDEVYGNINVDLLAVGSLIGVAYDTTVVACSVNAEIEYQGSDFEKTRSIGGLIGRLEKSVFNKDDKNQCYLRACEANVDFKINAMGNLYIGGLVGVLKNTLIENCQTNGSIEFISEDVGLNSVFIGAIVGFLAFEIDLSYINNLDRSAPLAVGTDFRSSANIKLEYFVDSANFRIGGLFGYVENYQLAKLAYLGHVDVNINSTTSDISLGGVVGVLVNSVHRQNNNFVMSVEEAVVSEPLLISSTGKESKEGNIIWGKTYVGGAIGVMGISKDADETKAIIVKNIFVSKINSDYAENPDVKEGQIFGWKMVV